MKRRIVLAGILKDNDKFLIVKRNKKDDFYPGAWITKDLDYLDNFIKGKDS